VSENCQGDKEQTKLALEEKDDRGVVMMSAEAPFLSSLQGWNSSKTPEESDASQVEVTWG